MQPKAPKPNPLSRSGSSSSGTSDRVRTCPIALSGDSTCNCWECNLYQSLTRRKRGRNEGSLQSSSSSDSEPRGRSLRPSEPVREYTNNKYNVYDDMKSMPVELKAASQNRFQRLAQGSHEDLRSVPEIKDTENTDNTKGQKLRKSLGLSKNVSAKSLNQLRRDRHEFEEEDEDKEEEYGGEGTFVQIRKTMVPRIDVRTRVVIDPLEDDISGINNRPMSVRDISNLHQSFVNDEEARLLMKSGKVINRQLFFKLKIQESLVEVQRALDLDAADPPANGEAGRSGIIRRQQPECRRISRAKSRRYAFYPDSYLHPEPMILECSGTKCPVNSSGPTTILPSLPFKFLDIVKVTALRYLPASKLNRPYDWAPEVANDYDFSETLPAIFWSANEQSALVLVYYIFPTPKNIEEPISVGTVKGYPGTMNIPIQTEYHMGDWMKGQWSGYIDFSRPMAVPQEFVYATKGPIMRASERHFWRAWGLLMKAASYGGSQYGQTLNARGFENPCRLQQDYESKEECEGVAPIHVAMNRKPLKQRAREYESDDSEDDNDYDDDDDDSKTVVGDEDDGQTLLERALTEVAKKRKAEEASKIQEDYKVVAKDGQTKNVVLYPFSTDHKYGFIVPRYGEEDGYDPQQTIGRSFRDPKYYNWNPEATGPEEDILEPFEMRIWERMNERIGFRGQMLFPAPQTPDGLYPHEVNTYIKGKVKLYVDRCIQLARAKEMKTTGKSDLGLQLFPWEVKAIRKLERRSKEDLKHPPLTSLAEERLIKVSDIRRFWQWTNLDNRGQAVPGTLDSLPRAIKLALQANKKYVYSSCLSKKFIEGVQAVWKYQEECKAQDEAEEKAAVEKQERSKAAQNSDDVLQKALERMITNNGAKEVHLHIPKTVHHHIPKAVHHQVPEKAHHQAPKDPAVEELEELFLLAKKTSAYTLPYLRPRFSPPVKLGTDTEPAFWKQQPENPRVSNQTVSPALPQDPLKSGKADLSKAKGKYPPKTPEVSAKFDEKTPLQPKARSLPGNDTLTSSIATGKIDAKPMVSANINGDIVTQTREPSKGEIARFKKPSRRSSTKVKEFSPPARQQGRSVKNSPFTQAATQSSSIAVKSKKQQTEDDLDEMRIKAKLPSAPKSVRSDSPDSDSDSPPEFPGFNKGANPKFSVSTDNGKMPQIFNGDKPKAKVFIQTGLVKRERSSSESDEGEPSKSESSKPRRSNIRVASNATSKNSPPSKKSGIPRKVPSEGAKANERNNRERISAPNGSLKASREITEGPLPMFASKLPQLEATLEKGRTPIGVQGVSDSYEESESGEPFEDTQAPCSQGLIGPGLYQNPRLFQRSIPQDSDASPPSRIIPPKLSLEGVPMVRARGEGGKKYQNKRMMNNLFSDRRSDTESMKAWAPEAPKAAHHVPKLRRRGLPSRKEAEEVTGPSATVEPFKDSTGRQNLQAGPARYTN